MDYWQKANPWCWNTWRFSMVVSSFWSPGARDDKSASKPARDWRCEQKVIAKKLQRPQPPPALNHSREGTSRGEIFPTFTSSFQIILKVSQRLILRGSSFWSSYSWDQGNAEKGWKCILGWNYLCPSWVTSGSVISGLYSFFCWWFYVSPFTCWALR